MDKYRITQLERVPIEDQGNLVSETMKKKCELLAWAGKLTNFVVDRFQEVGSIIKQMVLNFWPSQLYESQMAL
jgi:hypothetical protein